MRTLRSRCLACVWQTFDEIWTPRAEGDTGFRELTVEDIVAIIKTDQIQTKVEEHVSQHSRPLSQLQSAAITAVPVCVQVFEVASDWLEFDPERACHGERVLQHIRYALLPAGLPQLDRVLPRGIYSLILVLRVPLCPDISRAE